MRIFSLIGHFGAELCPFWDLTPIFVFGPEGVRTWLGFCVKQKPGRGIGDYGRVFA